MFKELSRINVCSVTFPYQLSSLILVPPHPSLPPSPPLLYNTVLKSKHFYVSHVLANSLHSWNYFSVKCEDIRITWGSCTLILSWKKKLPRGA